MKTTASRSAPRSKPPPAKPGIEYRFVPIRRGMGPSDVEAMQTAMRECGDGKLLAFCRSGNRSALAWAVARREDGVPRELEARRRRRRRPRPVAHLLLAALAAAPAASVLVDHQPIGTIGPSQSIPRRTGCVHASHSSRRARSASPDRRSAADRRAPSPGYDVAGRDLGRRRLRPRIALRCGKRPKRAITSWCFFAKPSR